MLNENALQVKTWMFVTYKKPPLGVWWLIVYNIVDLV